MLYQTVSQIHTILTYLLPHVDYTHAPTDTHTFTHIIRKYQLLYLTFSLCVAIFHLHMQQAAPLSVEACCVYASGSQHFIVPHPKHHPPLPPSLSPSPIPFVGHVIPSFPDISGFSLKQQRHHLDSHWFAVCTHLRVCDCVCVCVSVSVCLHVFESSLIPAQQAKNIELTVCTTKHRQQSRSMTCTQFIPIY